MGWEVVFSPRSKTDLQQIVKHIARDDTQAAARFGLALIETAESLASAPEMGPILPRKPSARFFPVGAYLIIYRLDAVRHIVRILRFWHAARGARPIR